MINVTVNVGFNTKMAVEEILEYVARAGPGGSDAFARSRLRAHAHSRVDAPWRPHSGSLCRLRKENADLREENRRLKARCGDTVAKDGERAGAQGAGAARAAGGTITRASSRRVIIAHPNAQGLPSRAFAGMRARVRLCRASQRTRTKIDIRHDQPRTGRRSPGERGMPAIVPEHA